MKLIGYFRSSAAFRVRIALNLKGIAVEHAFRHLRKGEHRAPDYVAINPQKLVPALVLDWRRGADPVDGDHGISRGDASQSAAAARRIRSAARGCGRWR